MEINVRVLQTKKTAGNMEFYLNFKTKVIGTEGARLLRENASKGDPAGASRGRKPRAQAEGGPPAESECLEWKSTFEFYKQKKLQATWSSI
ncbi:hypothetical protein QUF94_08770 [Peribacillus sp. NJ4]|uniref:hypothetical protein n=1 Tax=Peribacillus sp. NJ4 TaxID=3055862 RepID=UPI0025A218F4|nr:hypothetical protein [Peribacillus sp. NJ4]MDM5211531.1 hypothetical protein [Peribacillus sp. NJ4]